MYQQPIIIGQSASEPMVEICRSFAHRINWENYGGKRYEHSDLFASRKVSVARSRAAEESERIYQECRAEVRASAAMLIKEMRAKLRKVSGSDAEGFRTWQTNKEEIPA